MGILDIFKKKQQPLSFDIPPPPLDIPPSEAPAEFAGNTFNTTPTPFKDEKPARFPAAGDIEGKISARSLPPLPELPSELPPEFPPVSERSSERAESDYQHDLLSDIPSDLPSDIPSDIPSDLPPLGDIPLETSLPEFPELPQELPADFSLSPELEEPPHPDDLHIPFELPSISSEELAWPTPSPLVGSSALPERSFVFIPSSSFKDLLKNLDDVKERARQSAKSDAFITLKNKEDSLLNQMQGSLESMQRKLLYVDAALFEKQEA